MGRAKPLIMDRLIAWSMTDAQWRAAGCPAPYSVDYALAAARCRPDGGATYKRLIQELQGGVKTHG